MVNKEVVRKRLNKLDEYLAVLGGLQKYTRDEFLENPERYGSAERFLQLAIEALIDLGNYVIADLGLGEVDAYADIPTLLAERKMDPDDRIQEYPRSRISGHRQRNRTRRPPRAPGGFRGVAEGVCAVSVNAQCDTVHWVDSRPLLSFIVPGILGRTRRTVRNSIYNHSTNEHLLQKKDRT